MLVQPPAKEYSAWERIRRNLILAFCTQEGDDVCSTAAPLVAAHPAVPADKHIKVVCISDTHNTRPHIPDGDVLLHAGDLSSHGTVAELQAQLDWLASLPHRHKVVIAGNHDLVLDADFVATAAKRSNRANLGDPDELEWHDLKYLCRSSAVLDVGGRTLSVYGDPWTPKYGSWAFQHPATEDTWSNSVPPGTDILLTHGPPQGYLDNTRGFRTGSPHLLNEIHRARPRLVVFGHIHEGRGQTILLHGDINVWAREKVTRDTTPGLLDAVVIVTTLVLVRLWEALTAAAAAAAKSSNRSVLINAASMGPIFPREDESEAAGLVVYL